MRHIIKSENFLLELQLQIFESDMSFPVNTILHVAIESCGFSGDTEMDIDIKDYYNFVSDLQEIYNSLNGVARIKEPYGNHQFIEMFGDGKGHISVSGTINSQSEQGFLQELKFKNAIDQTQLGDFIQEICREYKREGV